MCITFADLMYHCTTRVAGPFFGVRILLYAGFETSTQGAGTKSHLKSRFCAICKNKRERC